MAAPFISLALQGVTPAVNNYDNVKEKVKNNVPKRLKSKGRRNQQDQSYNNQDSYDNYNTPSRRNTDQQPAQRESRGDQGYDGELTRRDRSPPPYDGRRRAYNDDRRERRYRSPPDSYRRSERPRARSVGQDNYYGRVGGRGLWRDGPPRDGQRAIYASDSESSVPPRERRKSAVGEQALVRRERNDPGAGTVAIRGGDGGSYRSTNGHDDESNSDSNSSSDVTVSSSEDERRARRLKYSVPLTAGFAAVASIHAANGIRKNLKKRDKRVEMKVKGEISPEESKKLENRGYLQDAAAVGLAVLSIKAVKAKWSKVHDQTKEYKETKKAKHERHERRVQKRDKAAIGGYDNSQGRYAASEQDLSRRYRDQKTRDPDRDHDRERY